ncbi:fimbria/pilus outer membrane usher protein [Enterobacteriaceae bacterium 4M9]|nr:fimbria/pilus outer membrane usher protein [Enterobacteriaceae bacterium 4M9]
MKKSVLFQRSLLGGCIYMLSQGYSCMAYSVEFNTSILSAEDRNNIDLSRFSRAGYIMPGVYVLELRLNGQRISEQEITFREMPLAEGKVEPDIQVCLTREQVEMLGLRPDALALVTFDTEERCADFSALEGIVLEGDLPGSTLAASIPQAWLEYQDATWLPPSRWEDGIPGLLLDYNVNATTTRPANGKRIQTVSSSGTAGVNVGAWRMRGDWQSHYRDSHRTFDWNRLYAYRALPGLMAKLTIGEDYLNSDVFDSWRYTGASLVSDESQLAPRLRGYAPEISGIARTNAKVTISQQGRVIYETTVAAGPFRIQELSGAVNGELDVRVEEQDGDVQAFQVTTATIPYLTRPGQVRYKLAAGRSSDYTHHMEGPVFSAAELSWGVNNRWSLYGGGILLQDYSSQLLGIGRDMYKFGAISADITQSVASLPEAGRLQGRSYRVSYSKRFEEIHGNLTFAGYRFSDRDYMTMPEYLDNRYRGGMRGNSKELYTVTASKSFTDLKLSAYLNWSHQTYWNRPDADRYSLSMSRYMDVGDWHNIGVSVSASRSDYNGRRDDAAWLSLTLLLGKGTASYNGNWNNNSYSQTVGWSERLNNGDHYRLSAGTRGGGRERITTQASGFYRHDDALGDATFNVGWQENSYTSAGVSLSGGMTATLHGAALHGGSTRGSTRMLVSTDGVSGVPIGQHGSTNGFGIAVDPFVPSYYRATTRVDVNRLADDVEVSGSPIAEAALTEGAIGFRRFDVLKGSKVVAILSMAEKGSPPFGASVRNGKDRELGMVSDGGLAWISGVNPGERLNVHWDEKAQCTVTLPDVLGGEPVPLLCHLATGEAENQTNEQKL